MPIWECVFLYKIKSMLIISEELTTKERLVSELAYNTFAMLRPSGVQGIGVFAVTDIKKGQRDIFSNDKREWIKIPKREIRELPVHSRELVEVYCLYDRENYYVPEYGFKMIDMVIFINHSDQPNIISINEGDNFEATRDIKAGEELFVNYGTIVGD